MSPTTRATWSSNCRCYSDREESLSRRGGELDDFGSARAQEITGEKGRRLIFGSVVELAHVGVSGFEERVARLQQDFVVAVDPEADASGQDDADDITWVMVGLRCLARGEFDSGELCAFD